MSANIKNLMGQFQAMQHLMKDANFKTLLSNPRVQELFKDEKFIQCVQAQDTVGLMAHPKLLTLLQDPELAALMRKVDFQKFMRQ
jgi:hypothetical protein